ncbi:MULTISPECIES: hypothetical protein [Clostridioides]|uniref:hypothetical protein n=1 Tax=unclassified Clostridioides TaxID=2635829 RepID=UPI001CA4CE22|nr:hypothetical protein [Clostridioides sp. ES-S-0001-03]MCC0674348.1 hypothetical protein [Clostridioides sp. ES-S-0145-01]MCC0682159.1 hypothetical protein [Clostridioides sp. ES-S-0005-03]MCC0704414.1 hypothetical protein [Clostridioides sp. ES-S-0049-02]MCC0706672.1 hypothetical protein [Clostridioides sp. ES-S-0190-01]MCC0764119.1 hypothetical protein [Clostridioides sp. ES-S-0006-03]MDI7818604.1 hypothetical protein [Clostridioides difficile]UDN47958.1 hypothetical protein JJJ25_02500 
MNTLCGGWSDFKVVEKENLEIFNEAIGMLKGVDYEPLIVSTQIVAGMNYSFICNATLVTKNPRSFLAEIVVFKPLSCEENNKAIITHINEIHNYTHTHR